MLPLQVVCPGWQTPVQTPMLQTNGQAAPLSQAPSTLQVCGTPDELHWREPGRQTPVQPPCLQTYVQAGADCHCPWLSQYWGMLPTQDFALGVQTPTQVPPAQRLVQDAPRCQTPAALQISGVVPSQRR